MAQSTTIVAFDQHADSIMAAVFPPDAREPVVQAVAADVEQVGRFVGKLARQGRALAGRQQGQPAPIVQQAWAAQQRLFHRYRRLTGRGKRTNVVITAVARELTAFAWAALVS